MKRGPDRLPLAISAIGYHENQNISVSNTRFLLQTPARRCHHADRGDGGIRPRRLDRPRLANRPRFDALPADAVRRLLFRYIGLILQGDLPLSDRLKF